MNVDVGIWGKLTKLVMVLLLIAGVMSVALWYLPLIQKNERYRKQVIHLDAEIQKEQGIEKETRDAIATLRTDPKAVERLAREKLGYARPGETVIYFEPSQTNTFVR